MKYQLKKLNKILSLILVFTVVLTNVICVSAAGTDTTVYGGDITTTAGSTITLPVSVSNNPGIAAYAFEFEYNSDVLTMTDAYSSDKGDFAYDEWIFERNGNKIMWSNDTLEDSVRTPYNTESDGEMLCLEFDISADAVPGIYPVVIKLINGEQANVSDCNAEPVEVTLKAGVVRITGTDDDKYVTNVTLYNPADKLVYWTGEDFLIDGAQLNAQYSDGTHELVDVTDEMLEAIPDMTVAGNKTVQILYYGWEYINDLTFDILVKDPSVVKVEMDSEPTKKVYIVGEEFDPAGGKIKITYDTDKVVYVDITEEMCSEYDMNTAGTYTVTVNYGEYKFYYDITVGEPSIVKVEMDSEPTKKVYIVGEEFDPTGGKIKITFNDGEVIYIDITQEMCGGFDMNVPGTYEVCVNYGDEKFYYEITVNDVVEPDDKPPAADTPDDKPPVDNPPSGDISLVVPITVLLISGMGVCITLYLKKRDS